MTLHRTDSSSFSRPWAGWSTLLAALLVACGTPPESNPNVPVVTAVPVPVQQVPAAQPLESVSASAPALATAAVQMNHASLLTSPESLTGAMPPAAPREFRAAWVATVANIDWPSRSGLSTREQQDEIVAMLDRAKALRLNAIILQVRPAADAIYPSALEPWTEYLSGTQGQAPQPLYDPLQMWVTEAHRRGLELHAWLNPYRVRHSSAKSPLAANHFASRNPEAVKAYGDMLWMDPAEPAAVAQTLAVVADIVRRYDVDGIHIDDYFYPYPVPAQASTPASPASALVPGASAALGPAPAPATPTATNAPPASPRPPDLDFPDEPAWQQYLASGGKLARADWRRQQVNRLVEQMHAVVHREKAWVKFGVSPFGMGRPEGRAPGITGFSQYDRLYADVELWLAQGWMDYVAPQLYWPVDQTAQSFPVLLDTWVRDNTRARHLWPGLFTSRIDDTARSWRPEEITRQIALLRSRPAASGHVHFSMVALLKNRRGVGDLLTSGPYASEVLIPATPWLGAPVHPGTPELVVTRMPDGTATVRVLLAGEPAIALKSVAQLAVWRRCDGRWAFGVQGTGAQAVSTSCAPALPAASAMVVSLVDRFGHEGPRAQINLR